ncbi:14144_t:CDS:2, partial [Dentiscutata erythropus]
MSNSLLTVPGVKNTQVDIDKLTTEIKNVCKEKHLLDSKVWLEKVIQLYQVQVTHHGLMMIGPSGSGKSMTWKVLLQALERVEGCKNVTYIIDPKVMSKDALYGNLDQKTNEWKDGLFTHILRNIIKHVCDKIFKRHWIIFDGDIDPEWVENFRCGTVWFSSEVVTLEMIYYNYLEKLKYIPLDDDKEVVSSICKVESREKTASPHLSIQYAISNMLSKHMTKDGLVTRTLMQAGKFDHIMDFTYMRVLNTLFSLLNKAVCNVIEYHIQHPNFPMTAEHLEKYVTKRLILCVIWSFSADAKFDHRVELCNFVCGITTVDLPHVSTGSILIDYDVQINNCEWILWADKNTNLFYYVAHLDLEKNLFYLKIFDQYCEYHKTPNGVILSPIAIGYRLVIICNEINLSVTDQYGTQSVISFLRQLIECGGYWRMSDKAWVKLERIQFVGICNPPTDPYRAPLSHRYLRNTPLIMMDCPNEISLNQIYGTFARAMLKVVPSLKEYAKPLTASMVEFYLMIKKRFTPDIQSHYIYSLRELTKWMRGIFESIKPMKVLNVDGLIRIWAHEALRLFQDRLVTDEERKWVDEKIDYIAINHFPNLNKSEALRRPILFSSWLSKNYISVEYEDLHDYVKARLKIFNKELDASLILFDDFMDHVLHIDHVFKQMQGHLLLIGVSGSGKTILSRFVAWMNGLSVFQINSHNKYTIDNFDNDLRTVLKRAGCKGEKICLIMNESSIPYSSYLERMNTLLVNAEVPGLFKGDEYNALITNCKEGSQRDGLMIDSSEELYKWFTLQIMKNLHIVFTMIPPEDGLASRASKFPVLFNCCALNWFGDWSDQALFQVGMELTQNLDLDHQAYSAPSNFPIMYRQFPLPLSSRSAVMNAFIFVHKSLYEINVKLNKCQGRYNYVTPCHYLDFITHYVRLFSEKRKELEEQQRHLNIGLNKLKEINSLRNDMNIKFKELQKKEYEANELFKKSLDEQNDAEKRKKDLKEILLALEVQNEGIEERRIFLIDELAKIELAIEDAKKSVRGITKQQLIEI